MAKKRNVVLYLDEELVEKTRSLGFNLSKTVENHLKQLLTRFSTVDSVENGGEVVMWGCPDLNRGLESPSLQEMSSSTEILSNFEDFCLTDLQLSSGTVKLHKRLIESFLRLIGKNPQDVTVEELRDYLKSIREEYAPSTYKNSLAALKRFYRDYLKQPEKIESFRFPQRLIKPVIVPTREELITFYNSMKSQRDRALFLFYASSGLRNNEVLSLNRFTDIDHSRRMIVPKKEGNESKHVWVSFYNEEAEKELELYLDSRKDSDERLFPTCSSHVLRIFRKVRRKCGVNVTPQILREWFCSEMGRLGTPDRYVDAFCGRVPKSVLARHYTDFSPEKLNEIYDKANLKVVSHI